MKKFSRYNRIFDAGGKSVLYNAASDSIVILLPETEDILLAHEDNPDELQHIHPDLYKWLLDGGMLVNDGDNEYERVIEAWKKEDNDPSTFSITINPTMDCNLRCWYCYENHGKDTKISPAVMEAVQKLVQRKVEDTRLKLLNITFFGGEPLLFFDETVLPILLDARQQCEAKGIKFTTGFTSNGVLLSEKTRKALQPFHKDSAVTFQITLDGGPHVHDLTRKTAKGEPTYNQIMANVKAALAEGFQINLRLNYTNKNAASFVDIIKDLRDLTKEQRTLLNIDFKQVWQDAPTTETKDTIKETRVLMTQEGFNVSNPIEFDKYRCYADKENNIVINYDGGLFNCTARQFDTKHREGNLKGDGTLEWNDIYSRRMAGKYGSNVCHECSIFPICGSSCSQKSLEANNANVCFLGYDEDRKEEILAGRVNKLLKR